MQQFIDLHSFRVVVRKNHLWISELVGIAIIGFILLVLLSLAVGAIINEQTIRSHQIKINEFNAQKISLLLEHKELREKARIADVLDSFTKNRIKPETKFLLVELVYKNSLAFGYDPLLLLAVIHVESLFDASAMGQYRSGALSGAFGLMQLKFETAKIVSRRLGIVLNDEKDLMIPEINIPLGVGYLTQQISRFKSLKLGILAYNQGPGTIRSNLRDNIPLSKEYYNKVLKSYYKLKKTDQTLENQH